MITLADIPSLKTGQTLPLSASKLVATLGYCAAKDRDDVDIFAVYHTPHGLLPPVREKRVRSTKDTADGTATVYSTFFKIDLAALPADVSAVSFVFVGYDGRLLSQFGGTASFVLFDGVTRQGLANIDRARSELSGHGVLLAQLKRTDTGWTVEATERVFMGAQWPAFMSAALNKGPSGLTLRPDAVTGEYTQPAIHFTWDKTGSKAIDLDLCCLWEMQDGTRGAIQSLGQEKGQLTVPPYISLGDDATDGGENTGETLLINAKKWPEIKRLLVYGMIYDGVTSWDQTGAVLTLSTDNHAPLIVPMEDERPDRGICSAVLIENTGKEIRFFRAIGYFRDQQHLDKSFGWGLRWTPSRKTDASEAL